MLKKTKLKLISAVGFGCLVFIGYTAFSIWLFSDQVQYKKSDAAVVLGAAVWDGKPSPVLRERVNHALWLYKNGYAEKLIFTGGRGSGEKHAESEAARGYALEQGVDEGDILIETESAITEENLQYAYEAARENHLNTFAIVSDPLHMKRAMLMAQNIGMTAYSSPTQSSAYQTVKSQIPFLCREVFFYIGYWASLPFR